MMRVEEVVSSLTDNEAVAMANRIHDRVFGTVEFADIEKSVGGSEDAKTLLGISPEQHRAKLDSETSVVVSRRFLESMAADENLAPVVEDTWEEVKQDDSMFVGTVIAVGIMVNLTLFMISSEIDVDLGKLKIHKKRVDTDAVKAVMEPISKAAGIAAPS